MTDSLPGDIIELRTIIARLDKLGHRVEPYVPKAPGRDDHMDLAVRSIWNAKKSAQWAVTEIGAAINEAMKGGG